MGVKFVIGKTYSSNYYCKEAKFYVCLMHSGFTQLVCVECFQLNYERVTEIQQISNVHRLFEHDMSNVIKCELCFSNCVQTFVCHCDLRKSALTF